MSEADRIAGNMARVPMTNGTTTKAVVDEILDRYSNPIICNGHLRTMVFTPITDRHYSYKTVPWNS